MASVNITNSTELIPGLDYYIPLPLAPVVIYNIISGLAVVANILNLVILVYMGQKNRQSSMPANYRMFLFVLSMADLTLGMARLIASNPVNQQLMLSYRGYCIFQAIVVHSGLMVGCTSVFMINIDRILAFTKQQSYQHSFFVKNFKKLLGCVVLFATSLYVSLGIIFRDVGYRVKGVGACKMGSEKLPSLGMVSVGVIFVELVLICICCAYLLYRTSNFSRESQVAQHIIKRNKIITITITAVVACKLVTWLPIMSTVLTRALKTTCEPCEWVGLITMTLNPLINPIIYGLSNRNYIRFVRALRMKHVSRILPQANSSGADTTTETH